MVTRSFMNFLRDESGAYTLWSLVWFMLYVAIGGLAVDITDAYRNRTLLQSTADSAAVAAIMAVGNPGDDPLTQANYYATANMPPEFHGDVLVDTDITLGNWDFDTRTFTAAGVPTNAVHVATRRAADNGNPVIMSVLRILGLFGLEPTWNVSTESIAVQGVSACHNNGLIAGGQVDQRSSNDFFENICVHGVEGLRLREGNTFESGVATSTTCFDCVGPPGNDPTDNEGWPEAWARGGENEALHPLNAYMVDEYVQVLRALPDTASYSDMLATYGDVFAGWDYLYHSDGSPPARVTVNNALRLPSSEVRNVAIVATCTVKVNPNDDLDMSNVAIAADVAQSNAGINVAGKGKFGTRSCDDLGMVELYTNGSDISFAAKGDVNHVRLISAQNIEWAAQANGSVGIMAEAVGDIIIRTKSDFGLCPNNTVNGPNQFTYRLVL